MRNLLDKKFSKEQNIVLFLLCIVDTLLNVICLWNCIL